MGTKVFRIQSNGAHVSSVTQHRSSSCCADCTYVCVGCMYVQACRDQKTTSDVIFQSLSLLLVFWDIAWTSLRRVGRVTSDFMDSHVSACPVLGLQFCAMMLGFESGFWGWDGVLPPCLHITLLRRPTPQFSTHRISYIRLLILPPLYKSNYAITY